MTAYYVVSGPFDFDTAESYPIRGLSGRDRRADAYCAHGVRLHATAYLAGRAAPAHHNNPALDAVMAAEAAADWKRAQTMHVHTSYYGAQTIRDYRAFWLGRLRSARLRGQA